MQVFLYIIVSTVEIYFPRHPLNAMHENTQSAILKNHASDNSSLYSQWWLLISSFVSLNELLPLSPFISVIEQYKMLLLPVQLTTGS